MKRRFGLVLLLILVQASPAGAHLQLPATDGRGEPLVPAATLHYALHQQQTVIYLLLGLLVLCLAALVWLSLLLLRMQYTVERVAEAVRRTDVLALSFGKVSLDWEHREHDNAEPDRRDRVLDLDDGLPIPIRRSVSAMAGRAR